MDVKVNKINLNDNFFVKEANQKSEANFNENNFEQQNNKKKRRPPNKNADNIRINDYDQNILESFAYKDLTDEVLKLECTITALENKLLKLNSEIETLEGLNSDILLSDLKFKRDLTEKNLKKLKIQYENISISTGISSHIAGFLSKLGKQNVFLACSDFILRHILPKCSKKFKYSVMVKDALNSLYSINSHVDELIKMQSPYGEAETKYEQLTAFINRANYLHSQIIANKKR
ncbi:hypothetical protein IJ732_06945 [bacterium]|nr:hypothetical protein [bacterium]